MRSIERSGKVRNGISLRKFYNRRIFWERKESEFISDKQNISRKWNFRQAHIFKIKKQDLDSPTGKHIMICRSYSSANPAERQDISPTAVTSQWRSYNKEICVRSIRRSTAGIECGKHRRDLPAFSCAKSSIYHSVVIYFVLRITANPAYNETQWIWNIFSVSGRFHFNRIYEWDHESQGHSTVLEQ
jgi:hypothetical protein